MKICFAAWLALAISFSFTSAHADTIVDGTIGSAYGPAVSVQTVQTEFGDEDVVFGGESADHQRSAAVTGVGVDDDFSSSDSDVGDFDRRQFES